MTDVPTGGEGFELAAAFVSVSPDTEDFQEKLEGQLGEVDTVIQVPVVPDTSDFRAQMDAAVGESDTAVSVPVVPDVGDFRAQVDAALAGTGGAVEIPIVPDAAGFAEQVAAEVDSTKAAVEVPVVPDTEGFAAAVASEVDATKAAVEVPVVPDAAGFAAEVESEVAGTKAAVEVPVIPDAAGFEEKVTAEAEASKATAVVPIVPGDLEEFAAKTTAEADAAGIASGAGFGDKFSNVAGQMPLFGAGAENIEKDAAVAGEDSAGGFGSRFRSMLSGLPLFGGAATGIEDEAGVAADDSAGGFMSRFKGMLGDGAALFAPAVPGMEAEGATAGAAAGTDAGEGFSKRFAAIVGGADLMEMAVGAAAIAIPALLADKFQAAMTRIVTQAGVAASALAPLEAGVLNLAGEVGFSPDSLAASLYHVESSFQSVGISGSKALSLVQTAAEGARVGNSDLVDTTNALDATIVSGISGVKNYSQAMGALNAIVGSGDMTMQDLAKAMSTGIMAVAKTFGQNIDQVGAAIATLGDNNIRGAKAATDLRMAWQALLVPIAAGDPLLQHIGLTSTQLGTTLEHSGMTAAIQEFVQHLEASKVPVNEWGQYITEIFGKKAGVGIGIFVDQLARLQGKLPDIEKGAGDFASAWAQTQATVSQRLKELESGFEALGTRIGMAILPAVSAIAGGIASILPPVERLTGDLISLVTPAVTDFLTGLKTVLGLLGKPLLEAAAALLAVKGAMFAFNLVLDMNPLVRFGIIAILVVGAIDKLHGPLKIAAGAVAVLTGAWILFNTAITVTPLGVFLVIAAAIAALVTVIVKYHKDIWHAITSTWDDIFDFMKRWWPLFLALFGPLGVLVAVIIKFHNQIWEAITSTWDKVFAFMKEWWPLFLALFGPLGAIVGLVIKFHKQILGAFEDGWNAVKKPVIDALDAVKHAILTAFDDIADPVKHAFDAVKSAVTGGFDAWWKTHGMEVKEVWDTIWNTMAIQVRTAWDGITAAVKFGWAMVMDVFHAYVTILKAEWDIVTTIARVAWDVITTVTRVAWAVIMNLVHTGVNILVDAFKGGWDIITTLFKVAWAVISAVVKVGWGVIEAFLKPAIAGLEQLFTVAWAAIVMTFKDSWAVIVAVVKIAWAAIQAVCKIAWDILVGIFSVALDLITGHWKQAWTDMQTTATQVWNAIKDFFTTTLQALTTLFTQTLNNIKAFLQTTWDVITSDAKVAWNAIASFFTSWWNDEVAGVRSTLSMLRSVLLAAWNGMKTDVSVIWGAIKAVFTTVWDGLTTGFSNAVAGIQKVWDTLQSIIETPVKFIVNTIYDDGIVKVVNAVGSLIGLKLSPISFAEGGKVTQGTGPKSDDVLVRVSKGETIVSADHSQQLAPAMAAVGVPGYGAGGVPVPAGLAGIPGYASGGVPGSGLVGDVKHAAGDVGSAVLNVVGDVGKALANLTGDALATAASAILNPLLNKMPGGGTTLGADLKKIPEKMITGLLNELKGTGGATGSGSDIANYAASFVGKIPYVWGGTTLGPAGADCSGFSQAIYKHYGIDAPRSSEAQGSWVKKITDPQSGGLAFYHSPAGGADPGHVAIIQNGSSVISQGGGMGPQIMGLHGMPLLSMGVPPGGFGSAGGGTTAGSMSASAISALWTSMGGPASAAANMAQIAFAESGDDPSIVQKGEPPGLTGYGLYQITPTSGISQNGAYGNLLNASNNTKAAIALFRGAGNSYSPWSSDPIGAGLSGGGGSTNAGSGNPGGSQYSYAGGGVIPEPVVGYGTRSGRSYSFGENGPETVVPGVASGSSTQGGGSSGGGNVINFNYYGPQAPSPEQQQALFMKASAMIGVS